MPRWVKMCLLALVLAVMADTGLWYWATGQVIEQAYAWVAARSAEGMKITMGPPSREGWPFEARIRVPQASITTAPSGNNLYAGSNRLEADSTTIGVMLWAPQTLHVNLEGNQRAVTAKGQAMPFTTTRTELIVPLSNTLMPDHADVVIEGLHWALPLGAVVIDSMKMHGEFQPNRSRGSLQVDMLDLPPNPIAAALGERIQHFGLEIVFDGPGNVAPAAWKAAGGTVHLPSLTLNWGKLGVTAQGDGSLDDQLQPQGSLTARVTGAADTVDALAAARLIAPNAATGFRALLGLMQKTQPDGTSVVELPFTLKNQRLQMGQFPLMRVPEATW
jgi:hypothetical protein